MNNFHGVVPALVTPMNPDGSLNENALRKVVQFNIDAGVHGFWVAGGSGESIMLSDKENNRIAEILVDQCAGNAKVIMHVGAPTTERAAKMAEHAAKAGVDAICCVPPFFYGRTDEEIVEHYRIVAAAADVPLFVYNLPSATRVEITPPLMAKIQDRVPQLRGLKHSAPAFANVHAFANMGLTCFIGSYRLMLPALTIGASGCVDGPPNIIPELWVAIWKAYQNGDIKAAQAAQKKATDIMNDLWHGSSFHAFLKAALAERLGIDFGEPRPPGLPLTDEQRTALRNKIEARNLKVES